MLCDRNNTYNVLYSRLWISIHDLSVLYSIMISYPVNCLVVLYSRFHQISIHYLRHSQCLRVALSQRLGHGKPFHSFRRCGTAHESCAWPVVPCTNLYEVGPKVVSQGPDEEPYENCTSIAYSKTWKGGHGIHGSSAARWFSPLQSLYRFVGG